MERKKAVRPVVSTALLVMIVIILAVIIIIWSRGFIKEAITKNIAGQKESVQNLCPQIKISSIVNPDGSFGFTNNGNVPIYDYYVKLSSGGSSTSVRGGNHVNPGMNIMINGTGNYTDYSQVKIIPVLLGKTSAGQTQEYTCSDEQGVII